LLHDGRRDELLLRAATMETLARVSVGDFLAVRERHGWRGVSILKLPVTRITPTRVVCGERAFSKRSGKELGSSEYRPVYGEPWTPEHEAERAALKADEQRRHLAVKLDTFCWRDLTLEQLKHVVTAVKHVAVIDVDISN
jgi:hypothetical protein